MIRLNETPVELNGKKWVFYGGVYQYGSLNGSLGIIAKGPRGGHYVMISENLFNYGKPTVGGYIALDPVLRRKKRYWGMAELVKQRNLSKRNCSLSRYYIGFFLYQSDGNSSEKRRYMWYNIFTR